jgi:response regulator RpfG family c-di-GMP phosphodiesterase
LEQRPDAVLLDIGLPELAGVELCQTLRSVSYTAHIPIFAITDRHNGGGPQAAHRQLGVLAFFERPLDYEEVKDRLTYIMSGPRPTRRMSVRIKMRTILKLKGINARGEPFEELAATENVSVTGFLCNSSTPLKEGAEVEVYLASGPERYAGRARLARKEDFIAPWQRYGFHFEEKTKEWVLQE